MRLPNFRVKSLSVAQHAARPFVCDFVLYTQIHVHVCNVAEACLIKCKLLEELNGVAHKLPGV